MIQQADANAKWLVSPRRCLSCLLYDWKNNPGLFLADIFDVHTRKGYCRVKLIVLGYYYTISFFKNLFYLSITFFALHKSQLFVFVFSLTSLIISTEWNRTNSANLHNCV